jgi:hypothetical protein
MALEQPYSTSCGVAGVLCALLVSASPAMPALYECADSAGTLVYTDSPAQMSRCTRISSSPDITQTSVPPSLWTSTPSMPASPPIEYQQPLPTTDPVQAPTSSLTPSMPQSAVVTQSSAERTIECPKGLNPLNGFSALPCPERDQAEAASRNLPSTMPMPPMPSAPLPAPPQ